MKGFRANGLPNDTMSPDGIPEYGWRVVRRDGKVKFAGETWSNVSLTSYEGEYILMRITEYSMKGTEAWTGYPGRNSKRICIFN